MKNLDPVDYFIFIFVLLISLYIGLKNVMKKYYGRFLKRFFKSSNRVEDEYNKKSNMAEYLNASSSMSALPLALSLLASFFSATSLLGNPAEIYQYGIQYYISVLGMVFAPLIGAFVTGPMFNKLKVVSVFEYLELRYDSENVRLIAVFFYLFRNLIGSSIFIFGPSTSLFLLASVSPNVAIILIGSIGTLYTTLGGIRGIIWADVFQCVCMFSGLILIIFKGFHDIGSVSELIRINSEGGRLNFFVFDTNPFIRQSFWSLLIGMFVYFLTFYCIDQQMVQRFAAAKNIRTAQNALLLNIPGVFLLITMCCIPGLIVYAVYHKCDPLGLPNSQIKTSNQILTYYMLDKFKNIKGSIGILLSAIFAGSLSSVSSAINSSAAIIWGDFLKRFDYFKQFDDKKSTLTTKILVLLVGILSTLLAYILSAFGGNLIQMNFTLNGSFNAPILGVFILGSFFPYSNATGAIFGMISGFFMGIWLSLGAYIYKPVYPKLGFINECNNISQIVNNNLTVTGEAINLNGFNKFYSISYMWFVVIGTLTTIIVGIIVSILTGCNKKLKVDDSFYILRFLKTKRAKSVDIELESF
jgi:SSS family transporter